MNCATCGNHLRDSDSTCWKCKTPNVAFKAVMGWPDSHRCAARVGNETCKYIGTLSSGYGAAWYCREHDKASGQRYLKIIHESQKHYPGPAPGSRELSMAYESGPDRYPAYPSLDRKNDGRDWARQILEQQRLDPKKVNPTQEHYARDALKSVAHRGEKIPGMAIKIPKSRNTTPLQTVDDLI